MLKRNGQCFIRTIILRWNIKFTVVHLLLVCVRVCLNANGVFVNLGWKVFTPVANDVLQYVFINAVQIFDTVKHFILLYFRVNSREHRDAKIKSSPIISNVRNIEEYMTNRENKVSWIHLGWWPRENKVSRIISILQYIKKTLMYNILLNDYQQLFCIGLIWKWWPSYEIIIRSRRLFRFIISLGKYVDRQIWTNIFSVYFVPWVRILFK